MKLYTVIDGAVYELKKTESSLDPLEMLLSVNFQEKSRKNIELKDTAEMMASEDYKERFKAEFYQLEIRIAKLDAMLASWLQGTLKFTPTCKFEVLKEQLDAMKKYSRMLRIRAKEEQIEL